MPTKFQATSACKRYNQQRMVRTVSGYSINRYWQEADGDFLITGGSPAMRQSVLTTKLAQCLQEGDRPIIILSGDSQLAATLIPWIRSQAAQLTVSSPQYRNYHFFYGLSDAEIAHFFRDMAERSGYDGIPALHSYILAFLSVLRKRFLPSLPAMLSLAGYDDPSIANLGRNLGVSASHLAVLDHYAAAGASFRNLLGDLQHAFSNLSDLQTRSETNAVTSVLKGNVEQQKNGRCARIHLVDMSSADQNVINRYMAGEISFLLRNNRPFRLVLDSVNLAGCERLLQVLATARTSSQCEVGICCANPFVSGLEDKMLGGLYSRVILLNGPSLDPRSLETLLTAYGSYEHWEPVRKTSAGLFSGPFSDDWDTVHMSRNRLRLEDVYHHAAILSGNSNAYVATIVRSLRD